MIRGAWLIALLCSFFCPAWAQQKVEVRGYFPSDSVHIGEPVRYILIARYPSDKQILFPDSTAKFTPFEFHSKWFTPTRTSGGMSYDSVVYQLTTFDISPAQGLAMPVYEINPADSVVWMALPDSLYLVSDVPAELDSVPLTNIPLKSNTNYQPVSWLFNYPMAGIVIAILVTLLGFAWVIFGKRILRYFRMKALHKEHMQFLRQFSLTISKARNEPGNPETQQAVLLWKRYLENLDRHPLTKLSTREIVKAYPDPQIHVALSDLDKTIYGYADLNFPSFTSLQRFAEKLYEKRKEELTHGYAE